MFECIIADLWISLSTDHNVMKIRVAVTFRPSDGSASTDMILLWTSLHGLRNTSKNIVSTISHCICTVDTSLISTMQREYINQIQKCHSLLWAWIYLRWTEVKWKTVLKSHKVRNPKEERDYPVIRAQFKIQHPWWHDKHIWEGPINGKWLGATDVAK